MVKRLIGVVAIGAATLFVGAVPAYAAHAPGSTKVVTAKATTAKYVEWSAPTKYVEWSAPVKYVEWSAPVKYVEWSAPATVSKYVEW